MARHPLRLSLLALTSVLGLSTSLVATAGPSSESIVPAAMTAPNDEVRSHVVETLAGLPLSFEPNEGQTDSSVRFFARGDGFTLYLTRQGAMFSLHGPRLEPGTEGPLPGSSGVALAMDLVGANFDPETDGQDRLPGGVSYFKGQDPDEWLRGIPTYGRVRYGEVWPGIDVLFRGDRSAPEYDFILSPGADPSRIALSFRGQEGLRVDPSGSLVIATALGNLLHLSPTIYQPTVSGRLPVPGGFTIERGRVGFNLGAYDPSLPLIIDPPVALEYSTFLGGSGLDTGFGIAVDASGNAYVTGQTEDAATDFPTTAGAFDATHNAILDVFVAKVAPNNSGTAPDAADLLYSTFLGGNNFDVGTGIAVDASGNAYVTGGTSSGGAGSSGFPTTSGAFDATHNGGNDAFVVKLAPNDSGTAPDATDLLYSTFLGGSGEDFGFGIAVDASGNAHVTGSTADATTQFPATSGAFDGTHNGGADAFVAKVSPNNSGTAPDAADLLYSTFLGGSGDDSGAAIALDASVNAYVTGKTASTNFPATSGAFDNTPNGADAFVAKLSPNDSGTTPDAADLLYSTYLGGSGVEDLFGFGGIAVDGAGNAYVTGDTADATTDFPTTSGAFDGTHNGNKDAFLAKLAPNDSGTAPDAADLLYSTFLGGSNDDTGMGIAVDGSGNPYVTGRTASANFPTTAGAFGGTHNGNIDAFVAKVAPDNSGTAPDAADLLYSTYLGGSGSENVFGAGIAVDGSGNAYVTGDTTPDTTPFPTTSGAFDATHNGGFSDAFVAKLTTPAGGLTLDKADDIDPIRAGEPLTYTLTVTNGGSSSETAVVLTDTLPTNTVFFKATPSQGTCGEAGGVVTCSLGTIGAGNSATVEIIVYPTTAGDIENQASVSSASGPGPQATATTTVTGPSCTQVGTNGDDTMTGGSGVDVLCALSGNDLLSGEGDADVLLGGRGHDTLDGGPGGDELRGGPSIEDTADYSASPAGVTVDIGAGTATGASTDTLVDIEHARGSNFSDTLIGDEAHNNLFGLDGVDQINGLGGPDILSGNDGNDTIEGGSSNDILYGGLGNDTLRGQGGNDALFGHSGTDDCQGGAGSDTVSSCEVGQTSNG